MGAVLDHRPRHRRQRGRAAIEVNINPIRLDSNREDLRPEFPQNLRRNPMSRAIGAVDYDPHAIESSAARKAALDKFDVATLSIIEPAHLANLFRRGEDGRLVLKNLCLDGGLDRVGELIALGVEQLDAIVEVRIVACRNHNPQVSAQGAGQDRNRRSRQGPQQYDIDSGRGQARRQGGLEHIARQPSILANHRSRAMVVGLLGDLSPDRHGDGKRGRRTHGFGIDAPTNTVGAEKSVHSGCSLGCLCRP